MISKSEIKWGLGLGLIIIALVLYGASRFTHPDMTGVRWFLTYWKGWLCVVAVAIIGGYLMREGER